MVDEPIDVLLIGHVCRDETPDGPRLGGTVTFCALTARALGLKAGIVTSAPDDMLPLLAALEGIALARINAPQATTFTNIYTPEGRQQMLSGRAAPLTWDDIPQAWRSAPMVHLAPVADEVAPDLAALFLSASIAVTPQGWMRTWDDTGRVMFKRWEIPPIICKYTSAVVFSIEDVRGDERLAAEIASQFPVAAVTHGKHGCTVFSSKGITHIPATPVEATDPTGAGDIFAMAFFARLHATGDPLEAAQFANQLARCSVTREGLNAIPTHAEIEAALAALE